MLVVDVDKGIWRISGQPALRGRLLGTPGTIRRDRRERWDLPRWLRWERTCLLVQEMQVRSLGGADSLEEDMATHFSIPAWRIPWTEEPGGYSPWGCKESDTTERLTLLLF